MHNFTRQELESLAERLSWQEIVPVEQARFVTNEVLASGQPISVWQIDLGPDQITFLTSTEKPELIEFRDSDQPRRWSRFDALKHLKFGGNYGRAVDFLKARFDIDETSIASMGRELHGERLRDSLSIPPRERGNYDVEFADLVANEQYTLEARALAKERMRAAQLEGDPEPTEAISLSDFLCQEDVHQDYLIQDLAVRRATVIPYAQAKVGKTTLAGNLVRSLADREPFLNYFDVAEHPGNIGYVNFELDARQCRSWLSDMSISNTDKVVIWNLRGCINPFRSRDAMLQFAEAHVMPNGIETLIIDPLSGAFIGDTNSNDEVKHFFLELEEFKLAAGVSNLFILVHAGNDASRPRGATTLRDHPDALWSMSKDASGCRYFKAEGRDVDVDEGELVFEPSTRQLTFKPSSGRRASMGYLKDAILRHIQLHPGCKAGEIDRAFKGSKDKKSALREELIREGLVRVIEGSRNAKLFYPTSVPVSPESDSEGGRLGVSSRSPLSIGGTTTGGNTHSEEIREDFQDSLELEILGAEVPEIDWAELLNFMAAESKQ